MHHRDQTPDTYDRKFGNIHFSVKNPSPALIAAATKQGPTFSNCPIEEISGDHPHNVTAKTVPHNPGKMIMDTGDVELYPCLRCGLVFWKPRSR